MMTPIYLPDTGPARLGRALFFAKMAEFREWLERSCPPFSKRWQFHMEPWHRVVRLWPVAYLCTAEEAALIENSRETVISTVGNPGKPNDTKP